MARIDNTKRQVVLQLMANVENRIHFINKALTQELDNTGELDTTFKTGRDAQAKTWMAEIIKLERWLIQDYLGISNIPKAYTDTEIDGVDPDIRTQEE